MLWKKIMDISLKRGFFYLSNPIYNPIAGFYDYGPIGSLLREKLINLWKKQFIKKEGFYEVSSSIITPTIVLKASGHLENFTDPITHCPKCNSYFRADHIVEEQLKIKWNGNLKDLREIFINNTIKCPNCGSQLEPPKTFNLMFKTTIGKDREGFLRPETAQGIYTSFLHIFRAFGQKLPMGIGQVGKSFRNEISPRNALVRMREFTQMELEVFFYNENWNDFGNYENLEINYLDEKTQLEGKKEIRKIKIKELLKEEGVNEIFAYFLAKEWLFFKEIGLNMDKCYFRYQLKDERPHYSKANIDLEVETSYGNIEVAGNANRGNYDLSRHEKFSGQNLSVFIQEENKKIIPNVFEVSIGVDRLIFSIMEHTYREKTKEKEWDWFAIPPVIAPYTIALFPLMKKPELVKKTEEILPDLREFFDVFYYKSGSIGKRYAKADEIGIPYAITIDYQTLEDNTVTIRYRNDGKQERIKIDEIKNKINKNLKENITNL